jgi:hypothetical protein
MGCSRAACGVCVSVAWCCGGKTHSAAHGHAAKHAHPHTQASAPDTHTHTHTNTHTHTRSCAQLTEVRVEVEALRHAARGDCGRGRGKRPLEEPVGPAALGARGRRDARPVLCVRGGGACVRMHVQGRRQRRGVARCGAVWCGVVCAGAGMRRRCHSASACMHRGTRSATPCRRSRPGPGRGCRCWRRPTRCHSCARAAAQCGRVQHAGAPLVRHVGCGLAVCA